MKRAKMRRRASEKWASGRVPEPEAGILESWIGLDCPRIQPGSLRSPQGGSLRSPQDPGLRPGTCKFSHCTSVQVSAQAVRTTRWANSRPQRGGLGAF